MHKEMYTLADEIRKVNSGIDVFHDLTESVVRDDYAKKNNLLKLQLIRDDVLRSNMNVKKLVAKIKDELLDDS